MAKHENDIPLIRICSVWLYFDNADYTRIKLWAQIINCSEAALKLSMENVRYLENNKLGTKTEDAFLILIYNEMKVLTISGMKSIFDSMRKQAT